MRAFFELLPNKILPLTYTTYPSYTVFMSGDMFNDKFSSSSLFYLYSAPSTVKARTFYDAYSNFRTGSPDYSGSVWAAYDQYSGNAISNLTAILSSAVRMKNIYASSTFVNLQNFTSNNYTRSIIINIPSILYGSEVKPGSFVANTPGLTLTLRDDGYGGLWWYDTSTMNSFKSGTMVGNIMYQHGIALINKDGVDEDIMSNLFNWNLSFSGTHKIPMNMYILDAPKGEANFSTNSSYSQYDTGSTQLRLAIGDLKTYPTAIGLYNEDYELVATVKLSTPLYHDQRMASQIRAKLVF